MIKGDRDVFPNRLSVDDREMIFDGLDDILSDVFREKIWSMIYKRYTAYEDLRNS